MIRCALVVVDVQEDFLPPNGLLAVADGRAIVNPIVDLLDVNKYPWLAVVLTQDWHPKDHCLFACQHGVEPFTGVKFKHPAGEKNSQTGEIKTQINTVWPVHCVQGTHGATIEKNILAAYDKVDDVPKAIVQKGYLQDREYYLCFTDCWGSHKTEMGKFLVDNGITHAVFVGLAYDFCVLYSAVDALALGFDTFVLSSFLRSVYPDKVEETTKQYEKAGVTVVLSLAELESTLKK